ncbi:MAG: epoxyqueuosine reductase QueH [Alphaproteobacteria bacterium]|nr:epoxyqueuosine reductase QueH [Alphaproteobacteria bacterium]
MTSLCLPLSPPGGDSKILLHCCCAPCSGGIIERLRASGVSFTVFFFNPNIHPRGEYDLRKRELVRFTEKLAVPFVDADYDTDAWFERIRGLENEPERGKRCTQCFSFRLERAALFAHENAFPVLTSSLGISRYKDMDQVNACGLRAVEPYPDLIYWDINWRKQGGADLMDSVARREAFYRQNYCGCLFSFRAAKEQQLRSLVTPP